MLDVMTACVMALGAAWITTTGVSNSQRMGHCSWSDAGTSANVEGVTLIIFQHGSEARIAG
jgi:hypothetical protein